MLDPKRRNDQIVEDEIHILRDYTIYASLDQHSGFCFWYRKPQRTILVHCYKFIHSYAIISVTKLPVLCNILQIFVLGKPLLNVLLISGEPVLLGLHSIKTLSQLKLESLVALLLKEALDVVDLVGVCE